MLALLALFTITVAGAQSRVAVTGKVSDTSGQPMAGVTIIEQGTTNGTTTSVDGTYSLTVKSSKSALVFSSLGYTSQTIGVGSKNEINVSLDEDAINMNEVVVTGYGRTVTKDKLTAAISKVSGEVLERGVRANALTALAGTVTGVRVATTTGQPGAAPSIVIRGGAALDGTGSPLYVIDGVQKEDMNDINANDIESIEILKDAAATALYGARANAGVVLVTTKRGRVGRSEISFKANIGMNYLRKTNEFLEADDYLYYLLPASGLLSFGQHRGPLGCGAFRYGQCLDGGRQPVGGRSLQPDVPDRRERLPAGPGLQEHDGPDHGQDDHLQRIYGQRRFGARHGAHAGLQHLRLGR